MSARRYASVTARSVAHQTAIRHKLALIIDGRQRSAGSQSNDARTPTEKSGRRSNKNSIDPMICKRSKSGRGQLPTTAEATSTKPICDLCGVWHCALRSSSPGWAPQCFELARVASSSPFSCDMAGAGRGTFAEYYARFLSCTRRRPRSGSIAPRPSQ